MRRRDLLIGASAAWWLRPASAQPVERRLRRVALLAAGNPRSSPQWVAFDARLRELGYVEGRNLETIFLSGEGRPERFAAVATELIRARPEALVAAGPDQLLRAARDAANGLPMIMVAVDADPVAAGLIQSLARPGGNVTGIAFTQPELAAKRLELLKETLPAVTQIGMLWDTLTGDQLKPVADTAGKLGVALVPIELTRPSYDLEGAFATARQGGLGGLLISLTPDIFRQRARVAALALEHRMPAIYPLREFVEIGGLMSYGVNFPAQWRRAAEYSTGC
jgi:putative tryptophan/tyrosine transport system substrate-binding protein